MPVFRHILVPTDFEELSERALSLALELGAALGAQVTLVHATLLPPEYGPPFSNGRRYSPEEFEDKIADKLAAIVARAKAIYPRVDGVVLVGEPKARILEAATEREADLIVMATHARRGLSRALLGSFAEAIVRTSPIPVMTVSAEAMSEGASTETKSTQTQ